VLRAAALERKSWDGEKRMRRIMAYLRRLLSTGAIVGLLLGSAVSAHAAPGIADFQGYEVWKISSWYGLGGTTFWPALLTTGIPGSGSAMLGTGSPPNFTIPAGALQLTAGNSFPAIPPYVSTVTAFTGGNAKGTFVAGAGPGTVAFCPGNPVGCVTTGVAPATAPGRINVTKGVNQFGGTMQLLANSSTKRGVLGAPGYYYALAWNDQGLAALGGPTGGRTTGVGATQLRTTANGNVITTLATWPIHNTGVPWTTGKAQIFVGAGYKTSTKTTTGSDARTPGGNGNITLVSAALIHWYHSPASHWGMVGVSNFTMTRKVAVPAISTPGLASLVMLVGLGGIYTMRRRYVAAS
jgi:hypothetical protein